MIKLSILVLCLIAVVHTNNTTLLQSNKTSDFAELSTINSTKPQSRMEPLAQSQEVFRSVEPPKNTSISSNSHNQSEAGFRPSPHLETYYEFNRFPVVPALPEAKQISKNFDNYAEKPDELLNVKWPTSEQPWKAKVKFPTDPYPFYIDKAQENPKFDGGDYLKPTVEKQQIPEHFNWNQYERRRPVHNKHQFDFSAPVEVPHHKTYEFNTGEIQYKNPYNPWKKIIKFLTTILPFGLLISALTPTVISVTPLNSTQTRSRADDASLQHHTTTLINSLKTFTQSEKNNCEDRVLCELLVSASTSKNAEQHVDNLLNRFIQDEKTADRIEEIKQIFDAVRRQDCRPIICKKIKEDT